MNLRPGKLPRLLVCHSRRAGFSDDWPTIGFFTTASLKWSTTAAMANAPPSRSYRLDSVIACLLKGFLETVPPSSTASARTRDGSPLIELRAVAYSGLRLGDVIVSTERCDLSHASIRPK